MDVPKIKSVSAQTKPKKWNPLFIGTEEVVFINACSRNKDTKSFYKISCRPETRVQ